VVASEVRNLAQRSASAAKEIKQLIDDSVGKVEAGTRLVGQAGSTMDEVVASIRRVTAIVGEISNASVEQTHGIEQINLAITQMDQVTQQNAALVEQAAAAAGSMQEQAGKLAEAVSIFKLASRAAAAVARGAAMMQLRNNHVVLVQQASHSWLHFGAGTAFCRYSETTGRCPRRRLETKTEWHPVKNQTGQ
jgi:methyl-accepting chemotaxis protein